jgi:hypothetical protein
VRACVDCEQEMTPPDADSCTFTRARFADGRIMRRVPYSTRRVNGDGWARATRHRCHDCRVMPGGFHHFGCAVERCPRCRGQFVTCGCPDEDTPIP